MRAVEAGARNAPLAISVAGGVAAKGHLAFGVLVLATRPKLLMYPEMHVESWRSSAPSIFAACMLAKGHRALPCPTLRPFLRLMQARSAAQEVIRGNGEWQTSRPREVAINA